MAYHRVEKLRIKSPDASSAHILLPMLEDAFNTATYQGINGGASSGSNSGAMVFVRHLDLGKISVRQSPNTIALKIQHIFSQRRSTMFNIDQREAVNGEVVWFSDALVAWTRLIVKLCQKNTTSAWYWPLVKRRLFNNRSSIDDNQSPSLGHYLFSLRQAHGALAHVRMLNLMKAYEVLPDFLNCLQVADVQALVPEFVGKYNATMLVPESQAVNRKTTEVIGGEVDNIDLECWPYRIDTLKPWLARWGCEDVRSYWLVKQYFFATKIIEVPEDKILRIIKRYLFSLSSIKDLPSLTSRKKPLKTHADATQKPLSSIEIYNDELGNTSQRLREKNPGLSASLPECNNISSLKNARIRENQSDPDSESSPTRVNAKTYSNRHEKREHDISVRADMIEQTPSGEEATEMLDKQALSRVSLGDKYDHGQWDNVAGVFLLIPLLNSLFPDGMLQSQDARINLPLFILKRVLAYFSEATRTHCLAALDLLESRNMTVKHADKAILCSFSIPSGWHCYCQSGSGKRAINSQFIERASGLSYSAKSLNNILIELVLESDKTRNGFTQALPFTPTVDAIVFSVIKLLSRFMWRNGQKGLKSLVRQPGKIIYSNTHIDIVFDSSVIDLSIRRAGLDASPGWVPWLEKVVTFHYEGETLQTHYLS